jgi:hypothetical protein
MMRKSDVNEIRIELIRKVIENQNRTLISIKNELFPDHSEQAFRQWFKAHNGKYFIADDKLCRMENHLGIRREDILRKISLTFPPHDRPSQERILGMMAGITLPARQKQAV